MSPRGGGIDDEALAEKVVAAEEAEAGGPAEEVVPLRVPPAFIVAPADQAVVADAVGAVRAEVGALAAPRPNVTMWGAGPSPEPPSGMVLAVALEAISRCSTRPRESIHQTLLRRHYRAVQRRLRITASDDSDDNPVVVPGLEIGEVDKENVIDSEGSAGGAP